MGYYGVSWDIMGYYDIMGYNYDVTSNVVPQIVNQVAIVGFYKPTNVANGDMDAEIW